MCVLMWCAAHALCADLFCAAACWGAGVLWGSPRKPLGYSDCDELHHRVVGLKWSYKHSLKHSSVLPVRLRWGITSAGMTTSERVGTAPFPPSFPGSSGASPSGSGGGGGGGASPTGSTPSPSSSGGKKKSSGGAIAGAAIGAGCGCLLLGAVLAFLYARKKYRGGQSGATGAPAKSSSEW